ncbi:TrkH family potassium uptake protein [Taylorella asinigenitalis]|uniref:Trk system potassium uptake protein n=1 Tax=Taylorella asinigenitalis (strain MCE3) TaxID=1008459 RepID=G4QD51_TAYAM|nr:potassium transporter TrkG [Taylorella asinigenitalis]AEP35868.1 Potassium uptake protein TrkH [Taylorella asinigenitalis MCE3]
MKRFLYISHALGLTIICWSLTFIIPYLASLYFEDGWDRNFLYALLISLALGGVLFGIGYPFKRELQLRDGLLLVVLVWFAFPAIGTLPFLMPFHAESEFSLDFTKAYFEIVSAITTTGGTVISDVGSLPKSINLWRHTIMWFGGMGILLLAVAILPLLGVSGHQVMRTEASGPMKEEKLTPRIAGTAKVLYAIYITASMICFLLYRLSGLSWFDAWCHAGSTMSLGGFSTHTGGFAEMDNPYAEAVACVFMLFAGINFATHYSAIRTRNFKAYVNCPEAIPFLVVTLFSAVVISIFLYLAAFYLDIGTTIRKGFFNTISLATTTGYANADYSLWPLGLSLWMLVLGTFASSAGSTGGGMKMIRMVIFIKQFKNEIRKILHPHGVFPISIRGNKISNQIVISILLFFIIYGILLVLCSSLLVISGLDFNTAFSSSIATLSNIGPALGQSGPMGDYSGFSSFGIWVGSIAMLVGRLDIFTVILLTSPHFWKK